MYVCPGGFVRSLAPFPSLVPFRPMFAGGPTFARDSSDRARCIAVHDSILSYAFVFLTSLVLSATAPAAAQTTFTVNSTSDEALTAGCTASTGDCSLRGAIQEANAIANLDASTPDRITFDIAGTGPHVLTIGALTFNDPLPTITGAVVIDGTTEPDYDAATGTPSIVLDATDAFGGPLRIENHNGSTVTGLSLVDADARSGGALTFRDGFDHTVRALWIGVEPNGTVTGADIGIEIENASGVAVEENLIRGCRASGIVIKEGGGAAVRNRLSQNAIYGNGWTAIDLGEDGITPNDGSSDSDDGANSLLNKPVLASSSYDGTTLTVTYEVPVATTAAAYPLTVEFFEADALGQPQRFLGADTYDGGTETASIADGSLAASDEIVATATDANGNTSEVGVTLPPAATTYTVTTTADGGPGSLRRAIRAANNDPAANTIAFAISGSGPHTILPGSPLPTLYGPVQVDATTEPDYAPGAPAIVIDGSSITYRYGWGLKAEAGGVSAVRGLSIVNVSPGDFSGTGLLLVDTDRQISSSDTFEVTGCFFGVLPDGVTAAPNWVGLSLDTWYTVVGGTDPTDRVVASGNEDHGIEITPGVDATSVLGAYVGVAADGVTALGKRQRRHSPLEQRLHAFRPHRDWRDGPGSGQRDRGERRRRDSPACR